MIAYYILHVELPLAADYNGRHLELYRINNKRNLVKTAATCQDYSHIVHRLFMSVS
jgi:hypothetical protein